MSKKRIALALCAMATAMATMAQSTEVGMEIENLVEYCGENAVAEIYHSPKRISYSKCFRFDLPNKKKNALVLQELASLFKEHMNDAYQYREHKAGMPLGALQRVAYGDSNEILIDFFKYINQNTTVMLVKDSKDVSKRYCYVLSWYKAGKRLLGSVRIIYGKDPQYVADRPAPINAQSVLSADTVYVNDGNVSLSSLQEEAVYITKMNDVFETFLGTVAQGENQDEKRELTETEFLNLFGNLRASLLKRRDDIAVTSSLAGKMIDLCKNRTHNIGKETRRACANELTRMATLDMRDPYARELLQTASKELLKYNEPANPKK